jgi:hypothetical protein
VFVAHAERPLSLPDLNRVDPQLRLRLPKRDYRGGIGGLVGDDTRLARITDAPVVLGVRAPESFSARLCARSDSDAADIYAFADIAMREADGQQAVVLRCAASALTLSVITLLDATVQIVAPTDVPLPVLYWTLQANGADATARADLLDFLRVLHQGGKLEIINTDRGEAVGTLDAPGAPFDADLDRDLAFLTDVATLEEWSGMVLPLPSEVPAAEVARIAQAAAMIRAREIPVTFSGDIAATMHSDLSGVDEVELEQDFGVTVFGFDVPLGVGRVRLPVALGQIRPAPEQPELVRVVLRPVPAEGVVFALSPPPERVAYKRTLIPGEEQELETEPAWSAEWAAGEHQASNQLRAGQGIRFVTESAFFEWLAHADAAASD